MTQHNSLIPFAEERGWEILPQNPTQERNGELRFRDEEGVASYSFWRTGTVGKFEAGKQDFVRAATYEDMQEILLSPVYFAKLLSEYKKKHNNE